MRREAFDVVAEGVEHVDRAVELGVDTLDNPAAVSDIRDEDLGTGH